jgi:predicted site-specific integrase-resolvase
MSMLTTVYLIERYGLRLTMEQLAQVLGLAVATLHARIARGELAIPTYVDGKMRFADTRDVAEYLDIKRQEAQDALHAH